MPCVTGILYTRRDIYIGVCIGHIATFEGARIAHSHGDTDHARASVWGIPSRWHNQEDIAICTYQDASKNPRATIQAT